MKATFSFLLAAALCSGLIAAGCTKKLAINPEIVTRLKPFVAAKAAQESALAAAEDKAYSNLCPEPFGEKNFAIKNPDCQPFFAAAAKGDWQTVSNLWSQLEKGAYNPIAAYTDKKEWLPKAIEAIAAVFHLGKTKIYVHGKWEQPVKETFRTIEAFAAGNEKYSQAFGDDIIRSIPSGSIYFGGSDPGRFIVTALEKSHTAADPFFTLTPMDLADGSYMDYLRSMYGDKIYIPTESDADKCFQVYADAARQQEKEQRHPNEVTNATKPRFPFGGQYGATTPNALLAKVIFDKNTNREFYLEENVPLEWMFPYLEPHGLIMKINRQPLAGLSDEVVRQDRDYWTKYVTPMIGGWLNENTTVGEVTAFAEKVFLRHELHGFTGDPQFVQNYYSCRAYSRLRSSLGELYAWRAYNATDAVEKQRMNRAADLAYRQAFALCPYFTLTVYRYVNFLLNEKRFSEALQVGETAAKISSGFGLDAGVLQNMVKNLKEFKKQSQR